MLAAADNNKDYVAHLQKCSWTIIKRERMKNIMHYSLQPIMPYFSKILGILTFISREINVLRIEVLSMFSKVKILDGLSIKRNYH